MGGIGSVGTEPQFREMGLAHRILDAQMEWMKHNDYDVSMLLASIYPFNDIIPFDSSYLDEHQLIAYIILGYSKTNELNGHSVILSTLFHKAKC